MLICEDYRMNKMCKNFLLATEFIIQKAAENLRFSQWNQRDGNIRVGLQKYVIKITV